MRLARFTMEVLRPIPITPLRVDTQVVRPGRQVQFVRATLSNDDGRSRTPPLGGSGLVTRRFPAESRLWDRRGRIGRGNQSLLVAPR